MADTENPKSGDGSPTDIRPVSITEEMKRSYLDYAMSVIVSRALPDVRDGLKPVHRRILHSMNEQGHTPDKKYVKSARVVGDVMGKYHPHGDQAIYDALVRMAQDFSMRLQLIDGQGNFGSVDGDPAAAMRYTECRLAKPAMALLDDIDKDTVDFQANYDGNEHEPVVLPARYPNLLVNGAGGIAVGMATNIPPHNLGELIDACVALIGDPGVEHRRSQRDRARSGFPDRRHHSRQGRHPQRLSDRPRLDRDARQGRVRDHPQGTRSDHRHRNSLSGEQGDRWSSASPNWCTRRRSTASPTCATSCDRDGYRVVIELKRDAERDVVLNQLYRFTPLQSSFGANMVALDGGRPLLMTLKDMLVAFVAFREEVVSRRTKHLLGKARDRAHMLVGLAIAVANIDEVIKLIRASKDANEAREALMAREWPATTAATLIELIDDPRHKVSSKGTARLSVEQAKAILDLRLQRLTALGRDEIKAELDKLAAEIADYLEILRSRARIQTIIKDELATLKAEFATPRRTVIAEEEGEVEDEDLIQREDMVVTVSHLGYIKRVPLSTYRAQRRGGKGRGGMQVREEDFVSRLFVASTHTPVLFFSSQGQVYKEKVWRLPLAAPQARGKALINILPLDPGETITTIMPLPEDETTWGNLDVMFATTSGTVRRNKLSDFVDVRPSGIIAMKLDDGRGDRRRRHLHREGRRAAHRQRRPVHPLRGAGGARVLRPHLARRARHHARRQGPRDLADHPAPRRRHRRGARRLSQARQRHPPRHRPRTEAAPEAEEAAEAGVNGGIELGEQRYVELSAAEQFVLTLSERGLRQALVVLRVPHHRPRRQRHRGDVADGKDRQDRRLVPGRGERPGHAGHRPGQADPHAGRRHPHRRALDARRDRAQHGGRRARGVGRAAERGRGRVGSSCPRRARPGDPDRDLSTSPT